MRKQKKEIRKQLKMERENMKPEKVAELSQKICKHILSSDAFQGAQWIFAYYPLENEADVKTVAQAAWSCGKKVAFPKVFGDDMQYYQVDSFEEFEPGAFGVMEPPENHLADPVGEVLVLVPGVAFDRQGNRMGFGRGYYDRYLAFRPDYHRMGIAYSCQVLEEIPVEETDIPQEMVATEQGIWKRKKEMA